MNELLLVLVVIAVIVSLQLLLKKVKTPVIQYIRLTAGAILLFLVWFFSDAELSIKLLMSSLVFMNVVSDVKLLLKPTSSHN